MYSLHPLTTEQASRFLAELSESSTTSGPVAQGRAGLDRMRAGDSRGPDLVSSALIMYLAEREPSFILPGISLSGWEAMIERGVGMLMRPPSRVFVDAGLDRQTAQQFPIRLDNSGSAMAGAFVPATLVPQLHELLVSRLQRQLIRLRDAEFDPVLAMAGLLNAVSYAHANGTGLLEAVDVVQPELPVLQLVQISDKKQVDPALRAEFAELLKPPRKPGVLARLFGKGTDKDASASG